MSAKISTFFLLLLSTASPCFAQYILPRPNHTVVLILENHSYSMITGTTAAPYIHSLITDPNSAVFINSYAITHPSQPNYIDFYSGCNQGITNNNFPIGTPFTTPNLGRQLVDSGFTFLTYAEDLPVIGYNGEYIGSYARKHNPVTNWMGFGPNQLPASVNLPFTSFPTDFNLLPTVSYVIPNMDNDMHNGTNPVTIAVGDNWIYNNLRNYIEWAKTNNSLFILHYDEDDYTTANHILTLFTGEQVLRGYYPQIINHYTVLRTIESFYNLPPICNAAFVSPITTCWKTNNVIPIPIELTDFTAYAQASSNLIEWKTMTETNSDFFTLQHSPDAVTFTTIETIEAQGNSTSPIHYTAIDENRFEASTYYRLLQTNYDGTVSYTPIIEVHNTTTGFQFVAATTSNELELQMISETKKQIQLQIFSSCGEQVLRKELNIDTGNSTIKVDISNLNSGIYFVQLYADNQIFNKKIIIK